MAGMPPDRGCDDCWTLINDVVDETIQPADRAELERHLEECAACRRALADIQQIRLVSRGLPSRRPRADAWQRIARELEPQLPRPRVEQPRPGPAWRMVLPVAAVLALAVASAVWFVRSPASPQPTAAGSRPASTEQTAAAVHPSAEDLVRTVDEELKAAAVHYEKAIVSLEQIARSEQEALDPEVAATLQRNLGIIDGAIRDSRAAIQAQPSSQLAQDSLFEALRRKVALLEDTISLINAMRKGDQEGTAKAIQGMSKT